MSVGTQQGRRVPISDNRALPLGSRDETLDHRSDDGTFASGSGKDDQDSRADDGAILRQ